MFHLACISTNMLSNINLLCSANPFFVHGQWMAEIFGVFVAKFDVPSRSCALFQTRLTGGFLSCKSFG